MKIIKKLKNKSIFFILLFLFNTTIMNAKMYKILEKDFLNEIISKENIFKNKIKLQIKYLKQKNKKFLLSNLTNANKDSLRLIDLSYKLKKDIVIPDKNNKYKRILYKKGYIFNPIKYITILPPRILVFNPCKISQSNFVRKKIKVYSENKIKFILVNSNCDNDKLKKTFFKNKIFYLTEELKNKFKIKHNISEIFIAKDKNLLCIKEYKTND